jgi:hypothetical protein
MPTLAQLDLRAGAPASRLAIMTVGAEREYGQQTLKIVLFLKVIKNGCLLI